MTGLVFAGVETGGTKILARIADEGERVLADGRWPTTTPGAALEDLVTFLSTAVPAGRALGGIGVAAFGPLVRDEHARDYGRVLSTPKPGWSGSNLAPRAGRRARWAGRV